MMYNFEYAFKERKYANIEDSSVGLATHHWLDGLVFDPRSVQEIFSNTNVLLYRLKQRIFI